MTARDGIFAGEDPFVIARRWLGEATETEPNDPNAMALATVDGEGMPDVRMVLLKEIEAQSFVFYTNYESAKGQQLDLTGKAALVLHWKSLRRQIRVRGVVTREEGRQADAYYASRPLQSRIGAWSSPQSRAISGREVLLAEVARQGVKQGLSPSRPPFWGGYRIRPVQLEFWADGAFRLHDRFNWLYDDKKRTWQIRRLAP
ncbi:pyridoxamine 5'-phosphate oxidase [Paracoccus tegillarcae]|uniref:Pyridoxine/pyridoxamine 5'-phosphate oxidase n=1 Tax=Paracoccus tegillarcae TaxID=1529068 RepID=A0A2K9EPN7_9RHOB|nr:pyridoxamine 5'-phosphate oxidase [Paracoccus tegillarcae]AUH35447.1 pyridoxamine 5'-phosphate oxidase [Paracoccus tegillarcae]